MEVTKQQFVMSYGKVVSTISKVVALVTDKSYLGMDGRIGPEDLLTLMPQLMMLMGSVEHFKVVGSAPEMFLDVSVKAELQQAFVDNFEMPDEMKELFIEDIHEVVLGLIKIAIKLKG